MLSSSVIRVQEVIKELRERHEILKQVPLTSADRSIERDTERAKLHSDVKAVIAAIGDATELLADLEDI